MLRFLKTFFQFPPVRATFGFFFCIGLLAVMVRVVLKPISHLLISDVALAETFRLLLGIAWLLICYRFFTRYIERRDAIELNVIAWKMDFLGGFTLGFGCISLAVFIVYVLGNYHASGFSLYEYSAKNFAMLLLAALIEDLLHRGLVLRILEQWLGSYPALVLAISIDMLHFNNPNIEFSFLGLFFFVLWGFNQGILYIYTKRIWLPFAFHVGWNFAQPFYGSNLTGLKDMGRVIDGKFTGSELISGGAMGIEGSVFTTLILFVVTAFFLYRSIKEGKIVRGKLAWARSI